MPPLLFLRRILMSPTARFYSDFPVISGAGCILCLWGSGKNRFIDMPIPRGGSCSVSEFTAMRVRGMISRGTSLRRREGPHPGHLSLLVSKPDDPTMIRYLSLGGTDLTKDTSLLPVPPVFVENLPLDVVSFRRMPDRVLNISFVDQQKVYDWIGDFQQNKDKRYHMLGISGYSCATSCREALIAGTKGINLFGRMLPIKVLLTPQLVFDEAQRLQMNAVNRPDNEFLQTQLHNVIDLYDSQRAEVNQDIQKIIDKLNDSLTIPDSETLQQIYNEAEILLRRIFPALLGIHKEVDFLPPKQPISITRSGEVIAALKVILIKETYLTEHYRKNYIAQIENLTYDRNKVSGPPNP